MIKFTNPSKEIPYVRFKEIYNKAISASQNNIEAINISSYSIKSNEINSRFVNLKFIDNEEFIFFSNYDSPKAKEFELHDQIAVTILWGLSNAQVRIKAIIKKTSLDYNKNYFKNRSPMKNALAISSNQSMPISSYEEVQENYKKCLQSSNLKKCPDYWGGYSFVPYYFEFWEGHESRLNKRETYEKSDDSWKHCILQP